MSERTEGEIPSKEHKKHYSEVLKGNCTFDNRFGFPDNMFRALKDELLDGDQKKQLIRDAVWNIVYEQGDWKPSDKQKAIAKFREIDAHTTEEAIYDGVSKYVADNPHLYDEDDMWDELNKDNYGIKLDKEKVRVGAIIKLITEHDDLPRAKAFMLKWKLQDFESDIIVEAQKQLQEEYERLKQDETVFENKNWYVDGLKKVKMLPEKWDSIVV